MADETLIKPIVKLNSGAQASVESTTVTLAIDRPPVAYIKFHPNTQGTEVIEALASDVSDSMGITQGALFTPQDTANIELTIAAEGGDIGNLSFKGMYASPNYGVATNNIAYSGTIVHESALLNSLDLSIYRADQGLWKVGDARAPGLDSMNLGFRIITVLKLLVERGIEFGLGQDLRRQQVVLDIHENINKIGLPILSEILENSQINMTSWTKILAEKTTVSDQINDHILAMLRQSTGSFFTNLDAIAESFQLIFVPSLDGIGHFITRAEAITEAPTETLKVLSGINLSLGATTSQPVTNVMTYNVNGATYKVDSNERAGTVYAYPDTYINGGRVLSVSPPPYIKYVAPVDEVEKPVLTIDIDDYENSRRTLYSAGLKASAAYEDLLKEWCRNIYCQTALADATASCQVPLNLNLKPGVRYQVSSENGKLFTGFLRQVTHTINGNRAGPTAYTQLDFNLVEAGAFALPFKNE